MRIESKGKQKLGTSAIQELKPDLLWKIFQFLPVTDLSATYSVCNLWRTISMNIFVSNKTEAETFLMRFKEYVVLALSCFVSKRSEKLEFFRNLKYLWNEEKEEDDDDEATTTSSTTNSNVASFGASPSLNTMAGAFGAFGATSPAASFAAHSKAASLGFAFGTASKLATNTGSTLSMNQGMMQMAPAPVSAARKQSRVKTAEEVDKERLERIEGLFRSLWVSCRILGELATFSFLGHKRNAFEQFTVDLLGAKRMERTNNTHGGLFGGGYFANQAMVGDDYSVWVQNLQQFLTQKNNELFGNGTGFAFGGPAGGGGGAPSVLSNKEEFRKKFKEFVMELDKYYSTVKSQKKNSRNFLQEFNHACLVNACLRYTSYNLTKQINSQSFSAMMEAIKDSQARIKSLLLKKFLQTNDILGNYDYFTMIDALAMNKSLERLILEDPRIFTTSKLLKALSNNQSLQTLCLFDTSNNTISTQQLVNPMGGGLFGGSHAQATSNMISSEAARKKEKDEEETEEAEDIDDASLMKTLNLPATLQELVIVRYFGEPFTTGASGVQIYDQYSGAYLPEADDDDDVSENGVAMEIEIEEAIKSSAPSSSKQLKSNTRLILGLAAKHLKLKKLALHGCTIVPEVCSLIEQSQSLTNFEVDLSVCYQHVSFAGFCNSLAKNRSIEDLVLNLSGQKFFTSSRLGDPNMVAQDFVSKLTSLVQTLNQTGYIGGLNRSIDVMAKPNLLDSNIVEYNPIELESSLNILFESIYQLVQLKKLTLILPYSYHTQHLIQPLATYLNKMNDKTLSQSRSSIDLCIMLSPATGDIKASVNAFNLGQNFSFLNTAYEEKNIHTVQMLLNTIANCLSFPQEQQPGHKEIQLLSKADVMNKKPESQVTGEYMAEALHKWKIPTIAASSFESKVKAIQVRGIISTDVLNELFLCIQKLKDQYAVPTLEIQTSMILSTSSKSGKILGKCPPMYNNYMIGGAVNPAGVPSVYTTFWTRLCTLLNADVPTLKELHLIGNIADKELLYLAMALKQNTHLKLLRAGYSNAMSVLFSGISASASSTEQRKKTIHTNGAVSTDHIPYLSLSGLCSAVLFLSTQKCKLQSIDLVDNDQHKFTSNLLEDQVTPTFGVFGGQNADLPQAIYNPFLLDLYKKTKKESLGAAVAPPPAPAMAPAPFGAYGGFGGNTALDQNYDFHKLNFGPIDFDAIEKYRKSTIDRLLGQEENQKVSVPSISEMFSDSSRNLGIPLEIINKLRSGNFSLEEIAKVLKQQVVV